MQRMLPPGLYLACQRSAKGVDHYGIIDVGNRSGHPAVTLPHPLAAVVIHQLPPELTISPLNQTGQWKLLGRISDEAFAIDRLRKATKSPTYDLFGNNCEHFARYVATGRRESLQLQAVAVVLIGIGLILWGDKLQLSMADLRV